MTFTFFLVCALVLDLLLGDPRWYPHPVRGIGWLCTQFEKVFRRLPMRKSFGGFLTVLFVIISTCGIVSVLLLSASNISQLLENVIAVILLYTTIAVRDLLRHSNRVYSALIDSDLGKARTEVGKIVGRDTAELTEEGVAKACVETVAENMVDGITAPLFYAVLFSLAAPIFGLSPISCAAIGAFFYKSVNTMDSMIGYKNSTYIEFGKVAALLDDLVNFLPARLSSWFLVAASVLLQLNYKKSHTIFLRDRLNHSSPNAGHPEAAVAGALGIQLGGPSSYFGQTIDKPYIGDNLRDAKPEDIATTNRLVVYGATLFFLILIIVRILIVI
jgi:adenosylcobinamide-phosphate synthase